jgi:hypothetical protein
MEFLIGVIIFIAVAILVAIVALVMLITSINERNQAMYGEIFDRIDALEEDKKGFVTDPFEKPKESFSSSSCIIRPKTPDQIRNENFKKIVEEGKVYGNVG